MVCLDKRIRQVMGAPHSYIYTVDRSGKPCMSSRGSVAVLDDRRIVFADLYACRRQEEAQQDRRELSVSVVNPSGFSGCRIRGRARVIPRGTEYNRIASAAAGAGQLLNPGAGYAVEVEVNEAEII